MKNRCGEPYLKIPADLYNQFMQGASIEVNDSQHPGLKPCDRLTYENGFFAMGGAEVVRVDAAAAGSQRIVIRKVT